MRPQDTIGSLTKDVWHVTYGETGAAQLPRKSHDLNSTIILWLKMCLNVGKGHCKPSQEGPSRWIAFLDDLDQFVIKVASAGVGNA